MTPVGAVPPHPREAKGRPYGKARRVVAQASCSRPLGPIHLLAPYKGSGGLTVQAPLERGLLPPKAVTGGFSSPAGAAEKNRSKETLRHSLAVPPPFSREVLAGGQCPPLRMDAPHE